MRGVVCADAEVPITLIRWVLFISGGMDAEETGWVVLPECFAGV